MAITAKQFGFTTNTGVIANIVDRDPATVWTPFATSFVAITAPFLDPITNLPNAGNNFPALELDMGEEVLLPYFAVDTETVFTLGRGMLIGSNSPATSIANTVQAGDVLMGIFEPEDICSGRGLETNAAATGIKRRYYRLVFRKEDSPVPVPPVMWNTADKSSGVVLSNTDHTATSSGGGNWGVRGTLSRSTGKWYIEFDNINTNSVSEYGVGFSGGAAFKSVSTSPEFNTSQTGRVDGPDGGGYSSRGPDPLDGHHVSMAVDLDANEGWIRYDGGAWTGASVSTADPVAGLNPYPLNGRSLDWFPHARFQNGGATADLNCGDTPFAYDPPAGFEPWQGPLVLQRLDGTGIKEFYAIAAVNIVYSNEDYDSIWGKGDRYNNGLLSVFATGLGDATEDPNHVFDNDFGLAGGNGAYFTGGSPLPAGGYLQFDIGGTSGIFLKAIMWRGQGDLHIDPDTPGFWRIMGGIDPLFFKMHNYDAFNISTSSSGDDFFQEVRLEGPGTLVPWPSYRIQWAFEADVLMGRFANELWLKLAHSTLDGGDRRNLGGLTPSKHVIISTDFAITDGTLSRLLDGHLEYYNRAGIFEPPDIPVRLTESAVAGKFIKFQFPRKVAMHHMVLQSSTQEAYGVGPAFDPQVYGRWQWQGSDDNTTWTDVGAVWKFKDACNFMLAPDIQSSGAGIYTFWRMVLVSGTAFVGDPSLQQFIFNLGDQGGQSEFRTINFTDIEETGGLTATPTLTAPGSAYVIGFKDDVDDKLTATVTIKPNVVLTVAFTDESSLDAFSDIYPSIVSQTHLAATGR